MSLALVPRDVVSQPLPPLSQLRGASHRELLLRAVRLQFCWLDDHIPSLPEVARSLAVSERTLRRYLRSLNTSYSAILQQVRKEIAQHALLTSDLTVDEIAAKLGYSETTNFRHAFRRWVGCSPQAYRLQARPAHHKAHLNAAA